ncbi:MAG: DUF4145 domain-containing protein [Pseudomonadota bacterium]
MTAAAFGHQSISKPNGSSPDSWHPYRCGHCGRDVSGAVIAYIGRREGGHLICWLQCPVCHDASVRSDSGAHYPGSAYGPVLEGLPAEVGDAYEEARRCLSVNANTSSEVMCRKILMHVAVDKGAEEGKTFAFYIDYLQQQGYVTPPMRGWVTLIKDHGNESNHKLASPDRPRAEGTLQFTAQLLRSVYEMEHLAQRFTKLAGPAPSAP